MSIENLVRYFGAIEDPRCSGKVEHRLLDIPIIAVSAVCECRLNIGISRTLRAAQMATFSANL